MKVTEKYVNIIERAEKITLLEGEGLTMSHDDFDPNWKHGDPIVGTMTFTDEPTLVMPVESARDLAKELDNLTARMAKLEGR